MCLENFDNLQELKKLRIFQSRLFAPGQRAHSLKQGSSQKLRLCLWIHLKFGKNGAIHSLRALLSCPPTHDYCPEAQFSHGQGRGSSQGNPSFLRVSLENQLIPVILLTTCNLKFPQDSWLRQSQVRGGGFWGGSRKGGGGRARVLVVVREAACLNFL